MSDSIIFAPKMNIKEIINSISILGAKIQIFFPHKCTKLSNARLFKVIFKQCDKDRKDEELSFEKMKNVPGRLKPSPSPG